MNEIKRETVKVNEVNLSVLTAGPREGETVMILHGFPEEAHCWEKQIEFLADLGFFVIAPDQRGYGDSEKPTSVSMYQLDLLAKDIIGLLDHYKREKVYLIGHDWGCVVSWFLISFYENRFKKAILMSSPHWEVFRRHLLSNPKQILKSWYILFIQIPKLPEFFLGLNAYKNFTEILSKSSNRKYPIENLVYLRKRWIEKNSIPTMLNWYRAIKKLKIKNKNKINVPVVLIWGDRDPFIEIEMGKESAALCNQCEFIVWKNTGHWPHYERRLELNTMIKEQFVI